VSLSFETTIIGAGAVHPIFGGIFSKEFFTSDFSENFGDYYDDYYDEYYEEYDYGWISSLL